MKIQPSNPPPGCVLRPAEKGNFSKEFSAIFYTSMWEKFHRRVVELHAQIAGMGWRNFTRKFFHSDVPTTAMTVEDSQQEGSPT